MRLGVLSQAGGTIDTFRESPLALSMQARIINSRSAVLQHALNLCDLRSDALQEVTPPWLNGDPAESKCS
jgi:hypothetical protein